MVGKVAVRLYGLDEETMRALKCKKAVLTLKNLPINHPQSGNAIIANRRFGKRKVVGYYGR